MRSDTRTGSTPPSETAIKVTGITTCFLDTVIGAIAIAAKSASRPKTKAVATMIRLRPKRSARPPRISGTTKPAASESVS